MGLKDILSKMRIMEVEAPPATPQGAHPGASSPQGGAPATRVATSPRAGTDVAAILASVSAARLDERKLPRPEDGDGSTPAFADIYRAASVADPPHGFGAFKVLELLSSDELATLEPRARASAVMGFLKMNPSGPIPLRDVIQDAVRRDQALDAYEEFLRKRLDKRSQEAAAANAALQAEVDRITQQNQEKMRQNRRGLEEEQKRLADWLARKRVEEGKLFDAVAPFVEQSPVSLGGTEGAGERRA